MVKAYLNHFETQISIYGLVIGKFALS
jgi:hypothetical protein